MREFKDSITRQGRRRGRGRRRRRELTAARPTPRWAAPTDETRRSTARSSAERRAPSAPSRGRPWPPRCGRSATRTGSSLVEHLDELRTRLIICVVAFVGRVRRLLVAEPRDPATSSTGRSSRRAFTQEHVGKDPLEQTARSRQRCSSEPRSARRRAPTRWPRRADVSPAHAGAATRSCARRPRASPRPRAAEVTPSAGRSRSGVGEPFTATLTVVGLRGAAALAAAAPLPGLRVRPAGVLAPRAPGRAPADGDGPVPVHRRRRVRLLHGAAAGDRLPAELQRRQLRHPRAGARLLQVLDHAPDRDGRAASRCRSGSSRSPALGIVSTAASCARTAATRSS